MRRNLIGPVVMYQSLATYQLKKSTELTHVPKYSEALKFNEYQSLAHVPKYSEALKFSGYQSLARTKVSRDQSLARDPQNAKLWYALRIGDLERAIIWNAIIWYTR